VTARDAAEGVLLQAVRNVAARKAQARVRPADDDELHAWVRAHLGVTIPRRACCPGHVAPFDAFADAYFARSSMSVWLASRGFGGKSFLLALLALTEAVTLGAEVNVLGGSADQSENVVRYTERMIATPTFPPGLLAVGDNRVQPLTKARISLANGGRLLALSAATRTTRGPHIPRLRIDEADEMPLRIFDASMGQTMERGGIRAQTVVSSTHHYPDGTFTEVLRRAAAKGWPVYSWCYRESMEPHGWLTAAEVERKRTEVTDAMWLSEYDLQEPSVEGRAINTDAVERAFDPALGEWAGDADEVIVVEMPRADADCGTGTDWAKKRDWTVIVTFRVVGRDPLRVVCVAWQRMGREPWPAMIGAHSARVAAYGGAALHDASGVGDVAGDYIDADVATGGVHLAGRVRQSVFSDYILAIEAGRVQYPRIEFAYREHKFVTTDALYRAGDAYHPPDSFVAGALAYAAAKAGAGGKWGVYDDV